MPVRIWSRVTLAPTNTAPLGSVTVPRIAVELVCPMRGGKLSSAAKLPPIRTRNTRDIGPPGAVLSTALPIDPEHYTPNGRSMKPPRRDLNGILGSPGFVKV